MKTKVLHITATLIGKVSAFVRKNEGRRITLGLTMSAGSLLYMLLFGGISVSGNPVEVMVNMIAAFLFVRGLVVLTGSIDIVNRFMLRVVLEVAGISAFLWGIVVLYEYYIAPNGFSENWKPFELLLAFFAAMYYIAKTGVRVCTLVKKLFTFVFNTLKSLMGKMESMTSSCDKTLKNVFSIAGQLTLIYKCIKAWLE